MKSIKIIIFVFLILAYICYFLKYVCHFWGIQYDIIKREKDFDEIANQIDELQRSLDIDKLIPKEIFRKTKWFKKYGNGWFDFVAKIMKSGSDEILISDFGNIYFQTSKCPSIYIHITILIIKQKGIDSTNIQKSILSKKFYSIYKKRSKVKIETIEDYTFILFDAPLNLESLKILKKCAIE